MPVFDTIRKLWNGRKFETSTNSKMSEINKSEMNPIMSAHVNDTNNETEKRILTQEEVNEQMGNYNAALTRQLRDWNRLIQRMSTSYLTDKPFPQGQVRVLFLAELVPHPTTEHHDDRTLHGQNNTQINFQKYLEVQGTKLFFLFQVLSTNWCN